jgi:HYR domain
MRLSVGCAGLPPPDFGATLRFVRRLLGLLVVLAALGGPGPAAAGELHFDVVLPGKFVSTQCSEGGEQARCFLVDIGGLVPGLGPATVHERVLQSGDMDLDLCEPQARHGRFTTARGTIDYVATGIDCPATREQNGGYRAVIAAWRILGGTGAYAGATGRGHESVRIEGDQVFIHLHGDVTVDALEFDTTRPVLEAVPEVVRVRSSRPAVVRYRVPVGRDAGGGPVTVRCTPPSGSRFRVGRTVVRCEAVDASGNAAARTFAVLVSPRSGR